MASSSTKEDRTFLQLLQDKYLECSLCIGDYRQPKSLACLHTFCLGCLKDFVKHNPGDIVCPTCRDITPIPKGGVEGLKSNFLIKALTDEAVLFKNQNVKCDNCEDGGNIASMVCVECAQYLCSTCYKSHQALKAIRDSHNTFEVKQLADIVNLREFQKNRFSTCQIHKDPMKLYCKKDSIQLCHTCAFASSHRGHIVCPLQEQLDDLSAEIEKSLGKCVIDEDQVKTENMKLKELVDLAKQTEKKSLDDIDNEENQLIKIVKEKYIKLREEIKKSSEETITSCEHKIEKNDALVNSYRSKVVEKDGLQMIPISLCIEAAEGVLTGVKEMMKTSLLKREESDEQLLKRFQSKGNLDDVIVGGVLCQFPRREVYIPPVEAEIDLDIGCKVLYSEYLYQTSDDFCFPGLEGVRPHNINESRAIEGDVLLTEPHRRVDYQNKDCNAAYMPVPISMHPRYQNMPLRGPTDKTPPHYKNGRNVKVGDRVRRGPDWQHGNHDRGPSGTGAVTQILANGAERTKIKWNYGAVNVYQMGEFSRYELKLVE